MGVVSRIRGGAKGRRRRLQISSPARPRAALLRPRGVNGARGTRVRQLAGKPGCRTGCRLAQFRLGQSAHVRTTALARRVLYAPGAGQAAPCSTPRTRSAIDCPAGSRPCLRRSGATHPGRRSPLPWRATSRSGGPVSGRHSRPRREPLHWL